MAYDKWFDTNENKALLAICTRKLIKNIGIGGIIWGVINTGIGIVALQDTLINIGLVLLGVAMLASGVYALIKPSLKVLLIETIITGVLFLWNVGINILNYKFAGEFNPRGVIFTLVITVVFANYYRKLGHVREQIASIEPEKIKETKRICKELVKKKLKNEPMIVQTSDAKCRAQLMDYGAFFIQNDLMRAFVGLKEDIRLAVVDSEAKKIKMKFHHPLGDITYQFNKDNTAKLKAWFAAAAPVNPSA